MPKSNVEQGEFVSPIFVVPKPDGTHRLIINLKKLNEFIEVKHFKMEDTRVASNLMYRNCFMSVVDQSDAYHAIPIHESQQKYLKFIWRSTLYKFTCVPFGLNIAPRLYTKIMRPVVKYLRSIGKQCNMYLDDCLLIDRNESACKETVDMVVRLYENLGLKVNVEKSQLIPSREVAYLGFILDSENMCIKLPQRKVNKVTRQCSLAVQKSESISLQDLAELIGLLVSVSPAVQYGQMYIRQLEYEKNEGLKNHLGNFDALISLSQEAVNDLRWWLQSINNSFKLISSDKLDLTIITDASLDGYGGHCEGKSIAGKWSDNEKMMHINELELLAVVYALNAFVTKPGLSILLRVDNNTALAYINKFGGCRSTNCHKIAKRIWQFCESKRCWITAGYISTKDNVIADSLSRDKRVDSSSEYKLNPRLFKNIIDQFTIPYIDLFASANNTQLPKYVSWFPDAKAIAIDAFTVPWDMFFYAFPPFNLILRVLKKIILEKSTGILVVPHWESQPWFPLFKQLVISDILTFEPQFGMLIDLSTNKSHYLSQQITLTVAVLCGKLRSN